MKLICSTVIRAAPADTLHGKLYVVDVESGSSTCISELTSGLGNKNKRGGDRGYRGIIVQKKRVIVAVSQGFKVFARTPDGLMLGGEFKHPRCLGSIHEICSFRDRIWATSTSKNCVVELSSSLEVLRSWEIRFTKGTPSRIRRTGVIEDNDVNHLNSISAFDDKLLFSGAATPLIDFASLKLVSPSHGFSHNFYKYPDMILVNRTTSHHLGMVRSGVLRNIKLPNAKGKVKCKNRDIAAKNWNRGLARHGDVVFIGSSPARILVVDLNKQKCINEIQLENDVRHCIHGLEILEP